MDALRQTRVQIVKTGEEGDQGAFGHQFTDVKASIIYQSINIGSITATLVNRQAIPENDFHPTFDEHSGDMEWIGSALLENKLGRTRLQSLCEYDDTEFDFLYITGFDVRGVHSKNSDIATAALYHFLRDPKYIKGELNYGCVKCTIAAFVAPTEGSDFVRHRVDPFLRNGFFQDTALVREDPDNVRILVSSVHHWESPTPKSQLEIALIPLSNGALEEPSGKDIEILRAVEQVCACNPHHINLSAIMIGAAVYQPPRDDTTAEQLAQLGATIKRLVRESGSLERSTALHAACEHNKAKIVKFLLDIFPNQRPALLRSKNSRSQTPLMAAAQNAAGRLSINGIDDTQVIDQLLGHGADRGATDSVGMTAYGYFRKSSKMHIQITHLHCRGKLVALESKLCPPSGPSMVDIGGGRGAGTEFTDYSQEDDEADREMGRGSKRSRARW